jgi:hypothetical protein
MFSNTRQKSWPFSAFFSALWRLETLLLRPDLMGALSRLIGASITARATSAAVAPRTRGTAFWCDRPPRWWHRPVGGPVVGHTAR